MSEKIVRDPEVTKYLANLKRKGNWKPVPDSYHCINGPFEGFEIFLTVGHTLTLRINNTIGFYKVENYRAGQYQATWWTV